MNRDLHEMIGSVSYEKLFAGLEPKALVHGATIRKVSEETVYERGTLFSKSSTDGKLVIFGTEAGGDTLTADCVLTDAVTVGTENDENVTVYISGCFNEEALIVADSATINETDRDELRKKGIILGTVQEP